MPQPVLTQLFLAEVAAAAVLGGHALQDWCYYAGIGVAVVALVLALVPYQRRWLFQVVGSWWGWQLRSRRRGERSGPTGLFGDYSVESVDGGRAGRSLGVVRCGTTWSLPLELGLDDVFNDDAAVPAGLLVGLLQIEDVALSSVRLFTLSTTAVTSQHSPAGPAAPMTQLAARYCLLTLDTRRAAAAIAARGGSQQAIHQILRRSAVHTEQVLATAGLSVRRLDADAVTNLFGTWMGPAAVATGRRGHATAETWSDVRVGGTWSTVFAVSGSGADLVDRVYRLAAVAPTPVVATSLVLRPGRRGVEPDACLLMRMSAPDSAPPRDAFDSLALLARAYDLVLQRVDGEQADLLRATTPLGVGER